MTVKYDAGWKNLLGYVSNQVLHSYEKWDNMKHLLILMSETSIVCP